LTAGTISNGGMMICDGNKQHSSTNNEGSSFCGISGEPKTISNETTRVKKIIYTD